MDKEIATEAAKIKLDYPELTIKQATEIAKEMMKEVLKNE